MDKLESTVGQTYTMEEVHGKQKQNKQDMAQYYRTGEFKKMPGFKPADFEDDLDYTNAIARKHKQYQTNYVVKAKRILEPMHKKTYF